MHSKIRQLHRGIQKRLFPFSLINEGGTNHHFCLFDRDSVLRSQIFALIDDNNFSALPPPLPFSSVAFLYQNSDCKEGCFHVYLFVVPP